MTVLAPYNTPAELRAAMSPATYMSIYDDDQSGSIVTVDASTAVALTLARAHSKVVSWLGHTYTKIPLVTDTDVPFLLKDAELNYAIALSYDRHPEYIRAYGADPQRKGAYDQAELTMTRVQEAILRFVDAPSMPLPVNVGCLIYDTGPHTVTDSLDGTHNGGDL